MLLTSSLLSLIVSAPPLEWHCYDYQYGDGYSCDCGCGIADPDCGEGATRAKCTNSMCGKEEVPLLANAALCAPNTCGDGFVGAGEVCDDGDGDGCDATCTEVAPGYRCSGLGGGCSVPRCGDLRVDLDRGERCDDGNEDAGDGCNLCVPEPGYVCRAFGGCYPTFCGDRSIDFDWETQTGETCEDGNQDPDDGCSAFCQAEPGYVCSWEGCKLVVCGNHSVERGEFGTGEQCDDGGIEPGDGCDADCRVEVGWYCDDFMGCSEVVCGDNVIQPGEQCDDGNTDASDGCGSACTPEPGWSCQWQAGPCHEVICGDGMQQGDDMGTIYEECDDHNTDAGDGCDGQCRREPGFVCDWEGACHAVVCGDGRVDNEWGGGPGPGPGPKPVPKDGADAAKMPPPPGGDPGAPSSEACDDGNTDAGDGCDAGCQIEDGYICPTPGVACEKPVCGDGKVALTETCDDGDTEPGDGCDAECRREPGFVCKTPGSPCESMPTAWVCSAFLYGAGDGCDCGCGTRDPDCAEPFEVSACTYNHCLEGAPYPSASDPTTCTDIAPPVPEVGPETVETTPEAVEAGPEAVETTPDETPAAETAAETAGADTAVAEAEPTVVQATGTGGCEGGGASGLALGVAALVIVARRARRAR